MMSTYGQKSGEGPTKGRKAETIFADIAGERYYKRVFNGQRYLTVCQSERDFENGLEPIVSGWRTEEEAVRMDERNRKSGCEFHAWAPATLSVWRHA